MTSTSNESPVQISIAKWLFWFHSGIAKEYVNIKFTDEVKEYYMKKANDLIDHICIDNELIKRKQKNHLIGRYWFDLQKDIK